MPVSLPIVLHTVTYDRAADRVFLIRRANTGHHDGHWSNPAGRLEDGEAPSAGARRELLEEAGVKAVSGAWDRPYVFFVSEGGAERIGFMFLCDAWEGDPRNAEPDKCDAAAWFPVTGLPEPISPHVRQGILNLVRGGTKYGETRL